MTPEDSLPFGAEMVRVADVFNEALSADKLGAYFEALAEYELAEVRAALRGSIARCRFFPRPVELIEAIDAARAQRAITAHAAELTRRLALQPATEAERADAEAARREFGALVQRVAAGMRPRAGEHREPLVVSLEDAAAFRERAYRSAALYRQAYGIAESPTPAPTERKEPS